MPFRICFNGFPSIHKYKCNFSAYVCLQPADSREREIGSIGLIPTNGSSFRTTWRRSISSLTKWHNSSMSRQAGDALRIEGKEERIKTK
jgi:hypothetical protein